MTIPAKDSIPPELRVALKANHQRAPYLSRWRHLKTGNLYVVQCQCIIEATLEPGVIYYRFRAPPEETWCRPAAEFFDGRFERDTSGDSKEWTEIR